MSEVHTQEQRERPQREWKVLSVEAGFHLRALRSHLLQEQARGTVANEQIFQK